MSEDRPARRLVAERLDRLPPYLFAEIDRKRNEARERGVDVIDLGVGDPDLRPPEPVIEALARAARTEGSQRYSSYNGGPVLRQACADWFAAEYAVQLDPNAEILPLLGSKEGIGHLALALLDAGDEVLFPDPGYPVYRAGTILAGGTPLPLPLRPENGFIADLDELESLVSERTKIVWLNYPSNPTTAMADFKLFEGVVRLAQRHGFIVCQDAAYAQVVFEGRAPSFLEAAGAREVGVEFHSLSKSFCMPGWRVGFAVGNADVIAALGRIKTNLDSGIFLPVQEAASVALLKCRAEAAQLLDHYRARRDRMVDGLRAIGWDVPLPPATIYVWAPVPEGHDSMSFAALLLEQAGVVVTPGVGFGRFGEGFVRMSLTAPDESLDTSLERIGNAGLF